MGGFLSENFQAEHIEVVVQCLAFAFVFFIGLTVGSAVHFFLPHEKNESFLPSRFAMSCIFLSIAAVLYTILVFYEKNVAWFLVMKKMHQHYFEILGIFFIFSVLFSLFWKVMLPVTFVLYVFVTIFTFVLLKNHFGGQKQVLSVIVNADSIVVDGTKIPRQSEDDAFFAVNGLVLSDVFVFPVRRNWFSAQPFTEKSEGFLNHELFKKYLEFFVFRKRMQTLEVHFSDVPVYPSLYSARIFFRKGSLQCDLQREL